MENLSSLRLYFTVNRGVLSVLKKVKVQAKSVPNFQIEEGQAYSGAWLELRNASDDVLYRQVLQPFLTDDIEVFKLDGGQLRSFQRKYKQLHSELEVLVPDLPDVCDVVLFHSRPVTELNDYVAAYGQPAVEVGRFALAEVEMCQTSCDKQDEPEYVCEKIVDNGDPTLRLNIVVLAEGYRQEELEKFRADACKAISYLLSFTPFSMGGVSTAFNFYLIYTISKESGSTLLKQDGMIECGGDDVVKNTLFKSKICLQSRLIRADLSLIKEICDKHVPLYHSRLLLINTKEWAGTSYTGLGLCMSTVADHFENIFVHELGHNVYGLADEYPYLLGCGIDKDRDRYTQGEPMRVNVTIETDRNKLKWRDRVAVETPLPTLPNDDCTCCPDGKNPCQEGTVGLYEGAHTYHCGVYRAQYNCMMRNSGVPFCRICSDHIVRFMQPFKIKYKPVTWLSFFDESHHVWSPALHADKELPQFSENTYDVACAGGGNQMLVMLIDDWTLYYNFTDYNGLFASNFKPLVGEVTPLGHVTDVACCYAEFRFFLFIINDGYLSMTWYYHSSGRWNGETERIAGLVNVESVSCTGVGGQVFVCVRSVGKVWINTYCISTGKWGSGWHDVGLYSTGVPDVVLDVDCCGAANFVNIILTAKNRIWQTQYTISNETWQSAFIDITNQSVGLGVITEITCAMIKNDLYVCAINNGKPVYTQRCEGKWNESFIEIPTLRCAVGSGFGSITSTCFDNRLLVCGGIQKLGKIK